MQIGKLKKEYYFMKILLLILSFIFVSLSKSYQDIKIKGICEWYHETIVGWHQNHLLFIKRHLEISDKSKYPDTNNKTIERNLLKQKKLIVAINNAKKEIQNLSKVYHYLECTRFEKQFEKN